MTTLNHIREGSGEPYVLIHGVGDRCRSWSPVIGDLAQSHEVFAIDLPGFGDSPADGTGPSIEAQTDRVIQFFSEVGIERPHVAGNSMGGGIALELARRGAVRSATPVSPVGFWTDKERRYCQLALKGAELTLAAIKPVAPAVLGTVAGRTALLSLVYSRPARVTPEQSLNLLEKFLPARPRLSECLRAFDDYRFHDGDELRGVPVTVAWGNRDILLLYRQAARAERMLPWANHVTLTGCGHVPFSDDPGMCAAVLLAGARASV